MIKFNINHDVMVKLTDYGREVLKQNHDKIYADLGNPQPYVPIKEDENGMSKWQLWVLMNEFGHVLYNGNKMPFESTIYLEI